MSTGLHRTLVSIALLTICGIGLWQARQESHRPPPGCPDPVEPLTAHQRILLGRPIDLNVASAEDLEALPRIGPVLARRIVDERRQRGPYASVDDLVRVKGIGPKTVERLRLLVTPR
jgi:competence protein ComEA